MALSGSSMESTVTRTSNENEVSLTRAHHRYRAAWDLLDQYKIELSNDNMYMEFLRVANMHVHDTNRVRQEVSSLFPERPDLVEAFNRIFTDRHSSQNEIAFTIVPMFRAIMDLFDQFRIELSNYNRFVELLQAVIRHAPDINGVRQEVSNRFPARPDLLEAFNQLFPGRHSSNDEILFAIALDVKAIEDMLNQFRIALSNDNRFLEFLQVVMQSPHDLNKIRQEVSNLFPERPDLVEAFSWMFPDRHSREDEIFTKAIRFSATMDLFNQFRIALSNNNRYIDFLRVVFVHTHDLNRIRQEVSNFFPERPDLVEAFNRLIAGLYP